MVQSFCNNGIYTSRHTEAKIPPNITRNVTITVLHQGEGEKVIDKYGQRSKLSSHVHRYYPDTVLSERDTSAKFENRCTGGSRIS